MPSKPKHTLKLYYFDLRSRAEHIRMALKVAGVPFADVTVPFEEWSALKPQMPLGNLPVLEVDGKVKIGQSKAIARFVGQEYGLTGKTSLERARLDMIADLIAEAYDDAHEWALVRIGIKSVPDKRAYFRDMVCPIVEKHASIIEKLLVESSSVFFLGNKAERSSTFVLRRLFGCIFRKNDRTLKKANETHEHFQVTWVDIYAAELFSQFIDYGEKNILDAFPHVRALVFRVQNIPAIKAHVAQRKPTLA